MADYTPSDVAAVVATTAGEGANQPPLAQQWIASTILNRANLTGKAPAEIASDPKQYEGATNSVAKTAKPGSPLYTEVANNIMPVLQNGPVTGATHFYNPMLQAHDGRPPPKWAEGDDGVQVGSHVFYDRAADFALPSPQSVLKSIGYSNDNQATAAPASTPPAPDELPSPNAVLKSAGWKPSAPKPSAPAVSPAQAKANAAAQATEDPANGGMETFLNSALFNGLPLLKGGAAAIGTGVDNALHAIGLDPQGGHPYGMGEAFTAYRDAQQQALDQYTQQHPIKATGLNVAGFGASGPGAMLEKGTSQMLAKITPRAAESFAGRLGIAATKAGVAGATAGGLQAASEGEDAGDVAKQAAISGVTTAPLGVAGHALENVPVPSSIPKAAVLPAVGAGAGAAVGAAMGGKEGALTGAVNGGALGLMAGKGKGGEPTPQDRATALDLINKAHPEAADALNNAGPHQTTAEALGQPGQALVAQAAKGGETATAPLNEQLTARGQKQAVMDRVTADVQQATGIDPATAHQDIRDQVDAARKGPAGDAYRTALPGNPVWTPQLSELAKEPEVRKALDSARRLMGSAAMVDNPAVNTTDTGAPIISAQDYQQFLKTGDESFLNGGQPAVAPTDETWDLAKQLLDKSVTRNALGVAEQSTENHLAQEWSRRLRSALDDAIPGYADARAVAGDYLSSQQAYEQGQKLWNTTRPDNNAAAFSRRFGGMTPAEQQATRMGYLSEFYRRMENGKFDPKTYLDTPFHQQAIKAMFGEDRAAQLQQSMQREQALSASAKATISSAKGGHVSADDHAVSPAMGGVLGFAEGGTHGAIRGFLGAASAQGAKGLYHAMREGRVTPQVRTALGDILAAEPRQTAEELKAARKPMPRKLSESTVLKGLGRGAMLTAGSRTAHAFSGLHDSD